MGYSFSPHIKARKKKSVPIGKLVSLQFARLRPLLKKIALADFSWPRSKYLPDHLSYVVFRAHMKYMIHTIPRAGMRVSTRVLRWMKRRKKATLLALLSGAFLLSLGWGLERHFEQQARIRETKELALLESKIEVAISVAKLNPLKAKGLVAEVEAGLSTLQKNGVNPEHIQDLQARLTSFTSEAFRVLGAKDFPVLYDLRAGGAQEDASQILWMGNAFVLLDKQHGSFSVYHPGASRAEALVTDSSDLKAFIDATWYGTNVYVLTSSGIFVINAASGDMHRIVSADPTWVQPKEIDIYQGTNIYILDPGAGKVWRYQGSGTTWGNKVSYYASGDGVDMKTSVSLAIDGNVWVTFLDGGVIKLLRGKREDFALSGLDTPFGSNTLLIGNEGNTYMYILDRAQNRLVQVNKLGRIIEQYRSDVFSRVTSFTVDEKEKKVYLLEGTKIVMLGVK